MKGWIGVDLDGTLAKYDGWVSEEHIGDPVPAMLARVKNWLEEGEEVRIFTARVSRENAKDVVGWIWAWCIKHGLPTLRVTCVKDYDMKVLYDDRCVQVEKNTGRLIGD